MKENQILEQAYKKAEIIVKRNQFNTFNEIIRKDIDVLIDNIGKNKSLVSALTTSLVKKIIEPKQDIRLHRTDFESGYSARSLDTKFTSPFFKKYFPKYANKESAFLTLATREQIKWTKEDGMALKVRNTALKNSFLNILEQIEIYQRKPEDYLYYLFAKLIQLSLYDEMILQKAAKQTQNIGTLNINLILEMLQKHFA
ncbi:MAG TPA: DNA methyltransferase, partial [Bacteroidetes bacterium]|nr:DNA methyltransferase [Bacteroidota bacterium]